MPLTPYPSLATMSEVIRNGGTIPPSLLGTVSGSSSPSWISLKYDVGIPDDATITGVGSPSAGDSGYGTQTLTSGPYSGQTVTQAIQATLDRAATGPLGVYWDVRCAIGTPGVPGFSGDELLSALKLRRPGNLHIAGRPGCGAILRAQCNAAMFANELPTFGTAISGAGTDSQVNSVSGIAFGSVIFEGLYLNANAGTITTLASAPNQSSPTFSQTYYLNLFRLFGVRDVTFRGCTFVNHAGFGVYLGNWQRIAWHGGTIQSNGAGGAIGGNDCFHLNGAGQYFLCRGLVAGTEDDHFSINTADGNNWSGRNHGAGGVGTVPAWGSLLDIDIEDVISAPTIRGNLIKIGSAAGCLVDRVRIRRVRGRAYQLAFINNSGAPAGPIGSVDFADLDCDWSQGGVAVNVFGVASSIRRVALAGVRRSGSNLSLPALQVNAGTVSDAAVSDYYASDDGTSGSGLAAVRVFGGATISRFSAAGVGLAGSSAGQVMPLLQVDSGGTVASAIVEGVTGTNIASVILNNGTLTNLGADNIKSDLAMVAGGAPGSTHGSYYGSGGGGGAVTLTGNVTGSGTGTVATTIAAGSVTNAMLAGSIAAAKLVGSDISIASTQVTGLGTAATHPATDFLAPTGSGSALTGITGSQVSGNIAGSAGGLTASIAESQVTGLVSDLAAKAPVASPAFTGPTSLAGGATTFDAGGLGIPKEFTFLLAQGANLANGVALASPGAIAGYAGKYTKWKALAQTNPSVGGFTFDITKNGSSIFGSPPSVAPSATTVQSGSVAGTFAEGDVFNVTVTSAGSGVASVRVVLYGLERNT